MKKCQNMTEVRAEIDRLDREIVPLLLERLGYIHQAGEIKTDRSVVRDEWRIDDVLGKVREKAEALSGDTDYITDIYRFLIEWSISHELTVWDRKNK